MADKIKMFAALLYIVGKGCITVDKIAYSAETVPVPKGKISEADAHALIKSGMAAEGPSKTNIVDMESAAKRKVKEHAVVIAGQHKELEKLKLDLKSLPSLQEKAAKCVDLEKEVSDLEKAAELKEIATEQRIADLVDATAEELKENADKIAKLEKDNEELKKLAGGSK